MGSGGNVGSGGGVGVGTGGSVGEGEGRFGVGLGCWGLPGVGVGVAFGVRDGLPPGLSLAELLSLLSEGPAGLKPAGTLLLSFSRRMSSMMSSLRGGKLNPLSLE